MLNWSCFCFLIIVTTKWCLSSFISSNCFGPRNEMWYEVKSWWLLVLKIWDCRNKHAPGLGRTCFEHVVNMVCWIFILRDKYRCFGSIDIHFILYCLTFTCDVFTILCIEKGCCTYLMKVQRWSLKGFFSLHVIVQWKPLLVLSFSKPHFLWLECHLFYFSLV